MRLRAGQVWVYRSDVAAGSAPPGSLVEVRDERGRSLGSALYSSSSQIALRMVSREVTGEDALPGLISGRIRTAVEYRRRHVRDSNACRLVFSEADALPGLIVDRYNDVLALQVLTQAMDRADLRQAVINALLETVSPAAVVERVDARIRGLEALPPAENRLLHGENPATEFTMNGVRFRFDALAGQKTGAFLDQRGNYAAAAAYAHGCALDICTYHGGFALHLARVCTSVTGVDASRAALEAAEQNEQLNREHHRCDEIEWIEGNAFDLLKDYSSAGEQYDTIVLDPPAFAKTRRAVDTALRGYKEINLRAMRMLRAGGILVTCSCSHHVHEGQFLDMLAAAAADAHRTVRVLEKRGASPDHPHVVTIPETSYLKCVVCAVY